MKKMLMFLLLPMILATCQKNAGTTSQARTLTIFSAASMGPTLDELRKTFEAQNPDVSVQVELSNSKLACAKVSDQGRDADLVISADYDLVEKILVPKYTSFNLLFASNALVLAYSEHSPYAKSLASGTPWQKVLAEPNIHVGIANPEQAPVGYRALLALDLNDRVAAEELKLGKLIRAKIKPENIRPDVTKLVAPLVAGEIDVAFLYKSEALTQKVPFIELDKRIDFSDESLQSQYAAATIELSGTDGKITKRTGSASIYSLSLMHRSTSPDLAMKLVALLLSKEGRAIAERNHLPLLAEHDVRIHGDAPQAVTALVRR